jgi:hypothetical protein
MKTEIYLVRLTGRKTSFYTRIISPAPCVCRKHIGIHTQPKIIRLVEVVSPVKQSHVISPTPLVEDTPETVEFKVRSVSYQTKT